MVNNVGVAPVWLIAAGPVKPPERLSKAASRTSSLSQKTPGVVKHRFDATVPGRADRATSWREPWSRWTAAYNSAGVRFGLERRPTQPPIGKPSTRRQIATIAARFSNVI
ncbi:MAG: hypothetical protein R3E79_51965 [Caldilineaceae bacterium]